MVKNIKKYKLRDIATIERAKKGKDYPRGATLIQVSATKGQTIYHNGGKVDGKYAVVHTKKESFLTDDFLYFYIKHAMLGYIDWVRVGLNIQITELELFPIKLPFPPTPKEKR